jgi:hypothetical protein
MQVRQIYLGVFLIFLVGSSVYVFPPGLPQPADFVMAFLVVVLATGFVIRPPVHNDLVFFGALFVGYIALINLFWYTQYYQKGFWQAALYYPFNLGATMVVLSLIRAFRERFVIPCQIAIAVAIAVEVVALHVLPRTEFRSVGTFNNPNQLGYWGLVLGCCWLVLKRDQKLTVTDFFVLCGAGYLTMESLSKAAMFAFVGLLLIGMISQRLTRTAALLFLALAFVGTSTVLLDSAAVDRFMSIGIADRVANRVGELGQQGDDSMAARGYDRIWRYPEHLVFGAGEGGASRFIKFGAPAKEMHSTLGTLLFSYGIIGFSLFVWLLVMVFRRAPLAYKLYSLPIWAYGMTHQGFRDTMLWVFLGIVFGMAHYARSASPQQTVLGPEPLGSAIPAAATGHELRASGARSVSR